MRDLIDRRQIPKSERDTQDYYKDLLINQYRFKPKAANTILVIVRQFTMSEIPQKLEEAFDLRFSWGETLDALASQFGLKRQFVFQGTTHEINDRQLRDAIRFRILKIGLGDSAKYIREGLSYFFGDRVQLIDNEDMSIEYTIRDTLLNKDVFAKYLIAHDLLPRPTGVRFGYADLATIFTPNLFRLRRYSAPAKAGSAPLQRWATYDSNTKLLRYDD